MTSPKKQHIILLVEFFKYTQYKIKSPNKSTNKCVIGLNKQEWNVSKIAICQPSGLELKINFRTRTETTRVMVGDIFLPKQTTRQQKMSLVSQSISRQLQNDHKSRQSNFLLE